MPDFNNLYRCIASLGMANSELALAVEVLIDGSNCSKEQKEAASSRLDTVAEASAKALEHYLASMDDIQVN